MNDLVILTLEKHHGLISLQTKTAHPVHKMALLSLLAVPEHSLLPPLGLPGMKEMSLSESQRQPLWCMVTAPPDWQFGQQYFRLLSMTMVRSGQSSQSLVQHTAQNIGMYADIIGNR